MAGVRRTWDKELYAQKARDRAEYGDDFVDKEDGNTSSKPKKVLKEEFKSAGSDEEEAIGTNKAFIKARDYKLELDHKAGKVEVINPLAEDGAKAGFWCEVCKCLLKDSTSYLDHLNGKKHQAALGYSMRVERADIDSVKQRLEALKRKAGASSKAVEAPRVSVMEEYQKRLQKEEEEKQDFKRRRKEEKKKQQQQKSNESVEGDVEGEGEDELQQMLGFNGFGSSKKK